MTDKSPIPDRPMRETVAILLWHRFAPNHHMEWEEETHKAEYLDAADAVIFRIGGRSLESALSRCDPRGPFFSTRWEREDYERRKRGEPELGPEGVFR